MRRSLVLGVALLAAMTLGRVLTEHVPIGTVSDKPFVRTGTIDRTLALRYADVDITDAKVAAFIGTPGGSAAAPAGRFLAVYATVTARREPTQLLYVGLLGGDGRAYAPTHRASCSVPGGILPSGVPYHLMYCFDVPRQALAGARLEVSHGAPGSGGGQARDDVGRIDLRLTKNDVATGWATKTGLDGYVGGFEQPDQKPLTLKESS